MTTSTPAPCRIAYIRTTTHPEKDSDELWRFLGRYMLQPSPKDVEKGRPRHRFIFGAVNNSDAVILDMLIRDIADRTGTNSEAAATRWNFKGINRADLELRMSKSRAGDMDGQKIIRRCRDEGIALIISGSTNEKCDEVMLQESDYLIDTLTPDLTWAFEDWFDKYARPGILEDNMLTNPKYNRAQLDVSKDRLMNRYLGHGWTSSSGAYHGNHRWSCPSCGKKCKRDRCWAVPSKDKIEASKRREEALQAHDDWYNIPRDGSTKWRDLTAKDLCLKLHLQSLPRYEGTKDRWVSIDTFSSE